MLRRYFAPKFYESLLIACRKVNMAQEIQEWTK